MIPDEDESSDGYEIEYSWDDPIYGPDDEEYFGEFCGWLFWISSDLELLVPKEECQMYLDEVARHSFDFNQRSFCRYFGITEEQYRDAVSYFEGRGKGGRYRVEKYPIGIFGTYEDFIEVFVREQYREGYKTEEQIPDENCIHTFTYHTISDELIDYVGDTAYAEFREQFYGTEDFNVLHFIEYFDISRDEMENILSSSADLLPAYKIDALYGDEDIQRKNFVIRSAQ